MTNSDDEKPPAEECAMLRILVRFHADSYDDDKDRETFEELIRKLFPELAKQA